MEVTSEDITLETWERFQQGDPQAFSHLYKLYAQWMFSYGIYFTSDRELVKDCIHEVFVRIYTKRKHLSLGNIKFYMIKSLRNELYNIFRDNRETCNIEEEALAFSPVYSVEDMYIENERQAGISEKVVQMLATLTPHQKEVIYYRFIEGLSIKEISVLMDMNYQSVQNLIQRSITKLRKEFAEIILLLLILHFFVLK
ncbi:RNA polymerase sigma factor [Parabacteroides pacaensis]|uniref:RNA polymerase sigma factor n=1 Tax=Parabacteroides pacaensis TaxID=2086575 RepID=UPI000D1004C3|nr:sigma-70 family RNA polymerase sigma factor [Parabacteroides pacaensis]